MPMYKRPDEEDDLDLELDNGQPKVEEPLSQEEQTWRKRYADLRRFAANKDKEINDLKIKLQNSTQMVLPDADNEAAIDQWIKENPSVARIITGLADRRAAAATESVSKQIETIEQDRKKLEIETAYRKLEGAHPDFFDTIRKQDEFHAWLATKSNLWQNAIYGDDNDWRTAIDVVTAYKAEAGKPAKRATKVDDLKQPPRSTFSEPRGLKTAKFSESQIARMSSAEYEANEAAIEEAARNNEIVLDVSGGVR